jgi:hypothetical protein
MKNNEIILNSTAESPHLSKKKQQTKHYVHTTHYKKNDVYVHKRKKETKQNERKTHNNSCFHSFIIVIIEISCKIKLAF